MEGSVVVLLTPEANHIEAATHISPPEGSQQIESGCCVSCVIAFGARGVVPLLPVPQSGEVDGGVRSRGRLEGGGGGGGLVGCPVN